MSQSTPPEFSSLPLADLLAKRRSLRRVLAARPGLQPVRIAILTGRSTLSELVDLLELHLLHSGFTGTFYQSGFNRFFAEAVHDTAALEEFRPDLVCLHTSVLDIEHLPPLHASESAFEESVAAELSRFRLIWNSLAAKLGCVLLQNTFELPPLAPLGNLDASAPAGHTRFVSELNRGFAHAAAAAPPAPRLLLNDVASVSARVGLDRWFDPARHFAFKIPVTPEASNALALSFAALIRAIFGRTRKVLVLDLDNTLWGGVIGEDGLEGIQIGRETAVAEAHTVFQQYCLALRAQGVLLAVCSKNDEAVAREGLAHPDSILRLEHFAAFHANWNPKPDNIAAIAAELNLSPESFVFIDDNPAERALVRAQIAGIAVPEIGVDPACFPRIIDACRYFERVALSPEDLARASLYQDNARRSTHAGTFSNYGEYLDSLEMSAEIASFQAVYLDRITQLTNKTNQFNLTSRRYTRSEIEALANDPAAIALYCRLTDRFGENGLISVMAGRRNREVFHIELWLMSCRVLKREVELSMLEALVARARLLGITTLTGIYMPTAKNGLVRDLYPSLGFTLLQLEPDGRTVYTLALAGYTPRSAHIRLQPLQVPESSPSLVAAE